MPGGVRGDINEWFILFSLLFSYCLQIQRNNNIKGKMNRKNYFDLLCEFL